MKNIFITWEFTRSIYLRYITRKGVISAKPLVYRMTGAQKMTMQLIRYSINCFYTFLKHSLRNSLYSMSAMKHWGGEGADVPALVFIKSIIGKYRKKLRKIKISAQLYN